MIMSTGMPIAQEDWEKTLPSVQAVLVLLREENQILKGQVARLQSQVDKLNEQVNKNSQNSSKPPSSDAPFQKPKYPQPELSGEKKGGRKGHHGHGRKLKPPDQVSRTEKSLPTKCKDCGAVLVGEDPHGRGGRERHQVSELPKIAPEIVEYQRHTLNCRIYGRNGLV